MDEQQFTPASIALTMNHAIGLPPGGIGVPSEGERRAILRQAAQIHEHHVQPLLDEIRRLRTLLETGKPPPRLSGAAFGPAERVRGGLKIHAAALHQLSTLTRGGRDLGEAAPLLSACTALVEMLSEVQNQLDVLQAWEGE